MPKVTVRPAARADLRRIGRYTEREWGREQHSRYLRQIDARILAVADNPKLGKPRDEVREGYRSIRAGRHVVFYREIEGGIEIVRILHGAMDAGRHLTRRPEDR
jgi:toxin ParE1/3/4